MEMTTLLTLAGLPPKLALLYRCLVEHGPASIAELERESGLHRPAIYKTLPLLASHGLVSKRSSGKRIKYVAAPPDALIPEIEAIKASIDDSVHDLKAAYEKRRSRPRVLYFEGKHGVQRVISDLVTTLKPGSVYYRYGSRKTKTTLDDIERLRPPNFVRDRDRKQLQRLVITSTERASAYSKDMNRVVKTVPQKLLFDDNIQLMIYDTKISIVDFESETGIIIEHQKLANFQRKLFKLLFERL